MFASRRAATSVIGKSSLFFVILCVIVIFRNVVFVHRRRERTEIDVKHPSLKVTSVKFDLLEWKSPDRI